MSGYKIIVVGGGPAGMMAAIRAAEYGAEVALFEKNASLGRKLGLTGKGRCNLTNTCLLPDFLEKFGKEGQFLRNAFGKFFAPELMRFFEHSGLELKAERQGRVFPASDSSKSIVDCLKKVLVQRGVDIYLSSPVKKIITENGRVRGVELASGDEASAQKVILSTGGISYPETGSTGDGFRMAKESGHDTGVLYPGLVPLETEENFVKELQGLALKNVRIVFDSGKKKIGSGIGEILFTHFGVSGPLVLDLSAQVVELLSMGRVVMQIDFKPALSREEIEDKLCKEFQKKGSLQIKNYAKEFLPQRFIDIFLLKAGVAPEKRCHQVSSAERKNIAALLKAFPVGIKRPRPISEAMVTCGGVSLKEVDPRTMESKKLSGLYFCGEILDIAASSGGFNLQAAFSTGYLAGESAALSC
ncbi:MAG TPA: NAD(P)/FAD-dependent oxidoreductase [Candidatus Omnitrophica bacterium]|nr:NAD(P)/FAD-dependent oxidoreductase [Candidatus Omnitrophota bacterium]